MRKLGFFTLGKILIFGGILAVIVGGYIYFTLDDSSKYKTIIVSRGEIVQEVSVTGKVKSANNVDLAFDQSGKIYAVYAKVSDKVYAGKVIVSLYNNDLYAELLGAQSDLKSRQADLDALIRGTRDEEIRVQEAQVESAEVSVNEAKKNLVDKINDAYTKTDDAVRYKVDTLFTSPRSTSPQLIFHPSDVQVEINAENGRVAMEVSLVAWKNSIDKLNVSGDLTAYTNEAKGILNQAKLFFDIMAIAVNEQTSDTWKSDVSTARTNINTATVNLTTAEEKLKIAQATLILEQSELDLKKAGATQEDINAQKAKVEQAEANVKNIQSKIEKTFLRSPINGIVSKQDAKVGEIAFANTILVSVISENKFEMEANIPEVDISKVKIGDSVKATLDAYGVNEVFEAVIVKIDPAETMIEGVATYKTTIQFVSESEKIKSGMTANIDILTAQSDNALIIPQRAVINENGNKFVKILNQNNEVEKIEIQTGIRGSDGNIEVIEGLKEGDLVIIE